MSRAALGFALCAVGCAGLNAAASTASSATQSAHSKAVTIAGFNFAPTELTVSIGDTVVWTNEDALLHTATADSGAWSSPEMRRGEAFRYVALRAGRFPYHCAAHPVMRAALVVRP